jgi:2',3'-cyclic-nucleotide 3'-phosphodiesterase
MSRHPKPSVQHSFPHFHPHVTLATVRPPPPTTGSRPDERQDDNNDNIDADTDPTTLLALALRESIPLGQRALPIRFARVLTGDKYFLSIYIALVSPSIELAHLRSSALKAKAKVGHNNRDTNPNPERASPAFPHLSLFYVADEEAHTRVRFLQEMEREGVVRHSADGLSVALRCAQAGAGAGAGAGEDGDGDGDGVLEGFTATQIWIVDCEGPVEEWKVLDKILLATSDR